jgi:three-Cys-motif partner protein
MGNQTHSFGGDWTTDKLERLRKYLAAYMKVMKNQPFKLAYIDAFAGSGYIQVNKNEDAQDTLLPDIGMKQFVEGSTRIALQTEPPFDGYIFIERRKKHVAELETLKDEFPHLKDRIIPEYAEANAFIKDLCSKNWNSRRAVMFLDPYGMQVSWNTIESIAKTNAIDLWILFPLGVAVNRLVKRNGKITEPVRRKLDIMFGATDWFDEFYRPKERKGLFDDEPVMEKIANFESIGRYFNRRLSTVFAAVADNPLPLYNSRNNPLYLLCFAAANEKGAPIAVRIAQNILKGKR